MADLPKPVYVDMKASLHRVTSAHKAVVAGIATHIEKEHAKRQAAYHKMEEQAKLSAVKPVSYD